MNNIINIKQLLNGKWYAQMLAVLIGAGAVFILFYIIACQDLSFNAIPHYDCTTGPTTEGVTCEPPEGLAVTLEDEAAPCDSAGVACVNDDGGNNGGGNQGRRATSGGSPRSDGDDEEEPRGRRDASEPWTTITVKLGRLDVLFVVDNSKSMIEELNSIANQFVPFLDSIKMYNYNIALTTTDTINDGGELLRFSNGNYFISNPDGDGSVHNQNVYMFQNLIQMPPGNNSDERGIYALNMVLDNMSTYSEFFRPHSIFMVVIVSDEDERSFGGQPPAGFVATDVEPLESYDLPETFFRKISHQHKFSIVNVHSIIIPPGGADCPNRCKEQGKCVEGRIYADASRPSQQVLRQYGNIREGHIGSICSLDYSSQLGPIAESLLTEPPLPLPCFPRNRVYAKVDGKKVKFGIEGRKILFKEKVPFGGTATIQFRCRR